jgi:hypothetical protein
MYDKLQAYISTLLKVGKQIDNPQNIWARSANVILPVMLCSLQIANLFL